MNSKNRLLMGIGVMITVLMLLLGAVAPGYAALPAQQTTPLPPGDQPVVTQVIPQTGGDADTDDTVAFSGWTLLLVLGIVIVVLLIALVARGSGHTHVDQ